MEVATDRPATELVRFAPEQKPGGDDEWIDQAGQTLLAQIKDAANVSKGNIEQGARGWHGGAV
jgi:hypothetical protein